MHRSQRHYGKAAVTAEDNHTNQNHETNWDDHLPVPNLSFWKSAIIVWIVAIGCYGNSYDGDFVFDDNEAILSNKDLTLERPWQDLFFNDFWGNKLLSNTSHKSYRPLTVLTFRLNYYMAGGLHPEGFHIVNICLHAVVCVLLLPVFSMLLGGTTHRNYGCLKFSAPRASLLAAVLFAVHPIHSESVAGVVGRADLLCSVCFLVALLCYVKATLTDYEGQSEGRGYGWLFCCLFLTIIATLCKEQGITVLGVCSAYDILGHHELDLLAILGRRKFKRQQPAPCVFPAFRRHLLMAVCGVTIMAVRLRLQGAPPTFQRVDNPHSFVDSRLMRALNYQYLYALNALLLLWPHWLCFDWAMGCVPVIQELTDVRILAGLTGTAAILGLCAVMVMRAQDWMARSCLLALAFIIIPFLPASNLFFRVGFVVAERILYLPSVGFIILVVLGASRLAQVSPSWSKVVTFLLCVLIGLYSSKSIQRSTEWRKEITLFESGATVCPNNAKVYYNLGKVLSDAGQLEKGVGYYRHAIHLHPEYDQAMNNLANILKDWGQLAEAEALLERAVSIRPEFAAAWMNLGIVQATLNKTQAAEASYVTALKHRKKYPDCYYNLGNLYLETGHHDSALSAWTEATHQRPTHISAWSNRLLLLDQLHRTDDVVTVATQALRYNPRASAIHYNLGNTLGKANRYPESERHFLEAIRLQGEDAGRVEATYYSNLGVLYHRWGKLTESAAMYRKALQVDPNSPNIQFYLQQVLNKLGKTGT